MPHRPHSQGHVLMYGIAATNWLIRGAPSDDAEKPVQLSQSRALPERRPSATSHSAPYSGITTLAAASAIHGGNGEDRSMKVYDPVAVAREAAAVHQARPAMAVVHDAPAARLVVFRLAAGQAVPVHTSVSSVVLHVLSGSGLVSSADGERDVRAGKQTAQRTKRGHGHDPVTHPVCAAHDNSLDF